MLGVLLMLTNVTPCVSVILPDTEDIGLNIKLAVDPLPNVPSNETPTSKETTPLVESVFHTVTPVASYSRFPAKTSEVIVVEELSLYVINRSVGLILTDFIYEAVFPFANVPQSIAVAPVGPVGPIAPTGPISPVNPLEIIALDPIIAYHILHKDGQIPRKFHLLYDTPWVLKTHRYHQVYNMVP